MSYLAIARKYRPATFADIVGQEHVVRTLTNALRSGRIHHAYLFCGARGVGKTTAARALAKALNCSASPEPTPQPCGKCTSCVEIASGSSPDLIEIDGASNNSVDDVRDLRDTVHYAPTRGRYKIYLVDEVHMLSKAAFNALLKTLEEPPPHVVFIFATTEPNRILDTILSRVQRFDFKRIPIASIAERLGRIAEAEGAGLSEAALRMIARAGDGSMRDAQSLLDKVISVVPAGEPLPDATVAETLGLVDRGMLYSFLEGLVTGDPALCLKVVAQVYDYGHELSEFTAELLELLRNATFVRMSEGSRAHVDASPDEIARLEALCAEVPVDVLTRTFNAMLDTHDQVSRSSRPRIVLEMAVARLATVRPIEPVSALLSRLEDLERRLRTSMSGSVRPSQPSPRRVRALPAPEPREAPRPAEPPPASEPAAPPRARTKTAPPKSAAPRAAPPEAAPPKAAAPKTVPPKPTRGGRSAGPSSDRWPDEAPPPIDADAMEPGAGPAPVERLWQAVAAKLRPLGGGAARLASGTPSVRGSVLLVALPAGRPLAEGRRARTEPEVEGAIRAAFPRIEAIEVVPQPGTGTPREHQLALHRLLMDDPDCRRIVQKLGAEIDTVTEIGDDER